MSEKLSERLEKWIKEDKPYCQVGFCEELCGEASGEKCGSYTLCHTVQDIRDLESERDALKEEVEDAVGKWEAADRRAEDTEARLAEILPMDDSILIEIGKQTDDWAIINMPHGKWTKQYILDNWNKDIVMTDDIRHVWLVGFNHFATNNKIKRLEADLKTQEEMYQVACDQILKEKGLRADVIQDAESRLVKAQAMVEELKGTNFNIMKDKTEVAVYCINWFKEALGSMNR